MIKPYTEKKEKAEEIIAAGKLSCYVLLQERAAGWGRAVILFSKPVTSPVGGGLL